VVEAGGGGEVLREAGGREGWEFLSSSFEGGGGFLRDRGREGGREGGSGERRKGGVE
jgi:hypothetical protein